jgi:two-component system cell cycle response regulator
MQSSMIIESLCVPRLSSGILSGRAPGRTLPPAPIRARRVLVVRDDTSWLAEATRLLRKEGYELTFCDAPEDAAACVLVTQPDVVLVPLVFADLCRPLRALDSTGTRAILAYGSGDDADRGVSEALESGADDCVSKLACLQELRARVRIQLRHVRDREMLHWARDQRSTLRDLAQTDTLTGLANRRALNSMLEGAVGDPQAVTVVLVDVDHFKHINDTHGHPAAPWSGRR